MKKVLHYVGTMSRGGIEAFLMNLYRNIDREEIQFDFAVHVQKKGDFDDEIFELGGNIHHFPPYRKNPHKYRMAWRKFFAEHKDEYTAFHFHTNSLANIVAFEEAARANVPIRIMHSHNSFANKGKLQFLNDYLHKKHRKKLKKLATNLFACSIKAADWLYGGDTLYGKPVTFVNNGVPCNTFEYNADIDAKKRKEMELEGKIVIGHLARFVPVKNHTFVVDILAEMIKKNPNVVGLLIGEGELFEATQEKIRSLGLEDNIWLTGKRGDVSELLMAMNLYIMPSLYEGLPVSLIEAQASGVPILVSDVVSSEVKLKDNLHFYSLSNSAKDWADKAFEVIDGGRIVSNDSVREAGYDIMTTTSYYTNLINK